MSVMGELKHISLTKINKQDNMYLSIFSNVLKEDCSLGMDFPHCEPHSGSHSNIRLADKPADVSNTAMHFAEGLPGTTTSLVAWKDETFQTLHNPEIGLHDFLSRPIKVYGVSWVPSNTIPETRISIMNVFLSNKRIANRINNFKYLNCTVNLRVVVSGTPMHYGLALMALNPWEKADGNLDRPGHNNTLTLNQCCQLPKVFIDPSTSTGGELSLPLVLPFNALDLTDLETINECLTMHVRSFNNLDIIGPDVTPAEISIWMWLTDVVLTNPTIDAMPLLSAQSGDEYGTPTVSRVSSTIATLAGWATRIPIISPYARATEMVAKGVSSVAEMFGYSRPNSLRTEQPISNKNIGNLTNYNFEDSSTKLTLDSKAEVTIDPSVLGVKLNDEMAIISIASREGYLGLMTWGQLSGIGAVLGRMAVSPTLTATTNSDLLPTNVLLDLTPLSYVTLPFQKWRGSLRFRFVVACSHFHKGRVRFVFDPSIFMTNTSPGWATETNVNQSYILDLACSNEMIITVPWASNKPYLNVALPTNTAPQFGFNAATFTSVQAGTNNGMLGAHVLMPLVSPDTTSNVDIHVFVSACDDFEVAEPNGAFANYHISGWEPQSGAELGASVLTGNSIPEYEAGVDNGNDILGTMEKSSSDKISSIHFGERIVSIRQLMKRYVTHSILRLGTPTPGIYNLRIVNNDFPMYKGWQTGAITSDVSGNPYGYARDSYMAYFSSAFLARRGGVRQKYVAYFPSNTIFPGEFIAARSPFSTGTGVATTTILPTSLSTTANAINDQFDIRPGGTAVYTPLNNCLEFETPYYSPNRFHFAQNYVKTGVKTSSDSRYRETFHQVQIKHTNFTWGTITRYVAAADDFSLAFYKYAPCVVFKTSPAPSVTI